MMIERYDDPDESVFKLIKKASGRRSHDPIHRVLRERLISKGMKEMNHNEFIGHFVVFISRKNSLNSKSNIYERKLKITLNEFFENTIENLRQWFEARKKPVIEFPITKKDKDLKNISEVKEKKAKALELRKKLQKEKENEYQEKKLMKKYDFDISDNLAKNPEELEPEEEEEEEFEEEEELMNDDSYFMYQDHPNFAKGSIGTTGKNILPNISQVTQQTAAV